MCIGSIVYVLVHILGQLLVQLAAFLSCHYCDSVPTAVCAWRWQINDDDDDENNISDYVHWHTLKTCAAGVAG